MADALFSNTQQRVLGLIFGQPDRSVYATEIIALAGGGSGAVRLKGAENTTNSLEAASISHTTPRMPCVSPPCATTVIGQ